MNDCFLLGRRRLLVLGGAFLTGCDRLAGGVDRLFSERAERALYSKRRFAAGAPARAGTPVGAFPEYFVAPQLPAVPEAWTLEIGGLVDRPLRLSLDELQRLSRTDLRVRHYCVEGWSAVASWHGVRLSEIARVAAMRREARCVEFATFDVDEDGRSYRSSWDLASALHPQTILAYGMNGELLGPGHGAPLRVYAAVKLGYKMAKYLTAVRFTAAPTGGYWEDQGYEWFAGV